MTQITHQIAQLQDRAVISLTGVETISFLQGLVTNDVSLAAADRAQYAALLTPQGKILFDFLVLSQPEGLLLDVPAIYAEQLRKRLSLYRLRAKVEIALRPDLVVLASWGDASQPGFVSDPRHPGLGQRAISAPQASAGQTSEGQADYLAHRLALGVPEAADFGQDKMFALDANLDELHAISFTKGCYVGQELTARMKHRGTARKRLLRIEADQTLPPVDTQILAGGKEIGVITSIYDRMGFATVRLDRLEDAVEPLLANGMQVRLIKQDWLRV